MGRKVLIVIDVQNCFLEGGNLAVTGADTPQEFANKINTLIKDSGFSDVFLTQDVHHPENVSLMNIDMHKNWRKYNEVNGKKIPVLRNSYVETNPAIEGSLGLKVNMYKNYPVVQKRRWGGDLVAQVLWPRHCIIRPDDEYFPKNYKGSMSQNKVGETYGSDLAFSLDAYKNAQHNYYKEPSHATIYHVYKGFDQKKDSYSAIADAVGEEDPFISRVNGVSKAPDTSEKFTKVLSQLNKEGITDIYVCGIATDFCVYQTTMDLIDLWMFSQKGPQANKPKVHLIYDLTRSVYAPGTPMHKSEQDYKDNVSKLLKDVGAEGPEEQYFVVDHYADVMKELAGKNVPPAPSPNNSNFSGAFSKMFGSTNANFQGGRRNKTRKSHKRGCNCKSCWPKMKGGKRKGTRKPMGHKKGCKCVVCRR